MCNNGFGGGNCCWIIILLIIIWCCCGNGSWGGNGCGCGCGNNCGCNPNPCCRTDAPGRCARGVFAGAVPGPPFPCALRSAVAQFLCLQRRFPRYAARLGPVVFIPLCPRKRAKRKAGAQRLLSTLRNTRPAGPHSLIRSPGAPAGSWPPEGSGSNRRPSPPISETGRQKRLPQPRRPERGRKLCIR